MSIELWIEGGTFAVLIIGIFVRMEQRMGKALTREEHEKICRERNDRVERQLDALDEKTERRHAENSQKLDGLCKDVGDSLGEIRIAVAILKDRQGEGVFDDAGIMRPRR